MGGMSIAHWAIVSIVVLIMFGKGKLSATMGDVGKGLRSFRQGLTDDQEPHRLAPGDPPSSVS